MANLKAAGRRAFVGPKCVLKTISNPEDGELWMHPRKLPIKTMEEIRELQLELLHRGDNREHLKRYEEIIRPLRDAGKSLEDATPEQKAEANKILGEVSTDPASQERMVRLHLQGGWGPHNLGMDDEKLICGGEGLDAAAIEYLMTYLSPTAMEGYGYIAEYNSPLAQGSATASPSSPNGSSVESSMPKESRSPMDGSPTS